ncbi:MAG: hypothetical protein INQ03_13340 [Candidatus Heimdallarchaeota archaeon]|nr:hypothetical protein [Candidatus Heimdallarchaeota archaeon]
MMKKEFIAPLILTVMFILSGTGGVSHLPSQPTGAFETPVVNQFTNQSIEVQSSPMLGAPEPTTSWYNESETGYSYYTYTSDRNDDGYTDYVDYYVNFWSYMFTGGLFVEYYVDVYSNVSGLVDTHYDNRHMYSSSNIGFWNDFYAPENATYTFYAEIYINDMMFVAFNFSSMLYEIYDWQMFNFDFYENDLDNDDYVDSFELYYEFYGYSTEMSFIEYEFSIFFYNSSSAANETVYYDFAATTIYYNDNYYFDNWFTHSAETTGDYFFSFMVWMDNELVLDEFYVYNFTAISPFVSIDSYADGTDYDENGENDAAYWMVDLWGYSENSASASLDILLRDNSGTTVDSMNYMDTVSGSYGFYDEGYFSFDQAGNFSVMFLFYLDGVLEQNETYVFEITESSIEEIYLNYYNLWYDSDYGEIGVEWEYYYTWFSPNDQVVWELVVYDDQDNLLFNETQWFDIWTGSNYDSLYEYYDFRFNGNFSITSTFWVYSEGSMTPFFTQTDDYSTGDLPLNVSYIDFYWNDINDNSEYDLFEFYMEYYYFGSGVSNLTIVHEFANDTVGSWNATYTIILDTMGYDYFWDVFTSPISGLFSITTYYFINGSLVASDFHDLLLVEHLTESYYEWDVDIDTYDEDDDGCEDVLYFDFEMWGFVLDSTTFEYMVNIYYFDEILDDYVKIENFYYQFTAESDINYDFSEWWGYFMVYFEGDYIIEVAIIESGEYLFYNVFEWYACEFIGYDYFGIWSGFGFDSINDDDYYNVVWYGAEWEIPDNTVLEFYLTISIWDETTMSFVEYHTQMNTPDTSRMYGWFSDVYVFEEDGFYLVELEIFVDGELYLYEARTGFFTVFDGEYLDFHFHSWGENEFLNEFWYIIEFYAEYFNTESTQFDFELEIYYWDESSMTWELYDTVTETVVVSGSGILEHIVPIDYQLMENGEYLFITTVWQDNEEVYYDEEYYQVELGYNMMNPPSIDGNTTSPVSMYDYAVWNFNIEDDSYGYLALYVDSVIIYADIYYSDTTVTLTLGSLPAGTYNATLYIWNADGWVVWYWMTIVVEDPNTPTTTDPTTTTSASTGTTSTTDETTDTTTSATAGGGTETPASPLPLDATWMLLGILSLFSLQILRRRK